MTRKFSKSFLGLVLILISGFFVQPAHANPIALTTFEYFLFSPMGLFTIFAVLYFISSVIEFGVTYFLLKKFFNKTVTLFKAVFLMNLVTFPTTQVLGFLILEANFDFIQRFSDKRMYGAEIFPLVAEYYIYKWWFKKLENRGLLTSKISNRRILITTTVMNLITFVLGVWLLEFI